MEYAGNAAQVADLGATPFAEGDPRKVGAQRPLWLGGLDSTRPHESAGHDRSRCGGLASHRCGSVERVGVRESRNSCDPERVLSRTIETWKNGAGRRSRHVGGPSPGFSRIAAVLDLVVPERQISINRQRRRLPSQPNASADTRAGPQVGRGCCWTIKESQLRAVKKRIPDKFRALGQRNPGQRWAGPECKLADP